MANRYIIHGATFNGDGTTNAAAASNGGVGAWNTITYFEGTTPAFGTLPAGTTVFIRSKNASNANITRTMAASVTLGSSAATASSWVNWIIDNGAVWSGVDGVITYTHANTYSVTVRQYNYVEAQTQNALVFANTSTNQAAGTTLVTLNGTLVRPKLDWSTKTGAGQCIAVTMGDHSVLESPEVTWGAVGGASGDTRGLIKSASSLTTKFTILRPRIALNNATVGMPIFYLGDISARGIGIIFGGDITGAGATTLQALFCPGVGGPTGRFEVTGLQFPRSMDVVNAANDSTTLISGTGAFTIIGCDGGIGGHLQREWGYATSRTDSNPPTLQALLPNSVSTPWSWRVYPKNASKVYPMMLSTSKLFTDSAATKIITLEVLVANTMGVAKDSLWVTVDYTDNTTGLTTHLSTFDINGGALSTSSAAWSAAVWGAISFDKKKLEVTTPTTVKQDSVITVTLWGTFISASANDIYFVDPDFGVN